VLSETRWTIVLSARAPLGSSSLTENVGLAAATVPRMRVDQLLLTLHILAAATWIGAALAVQVIAGQMRSSTPDAVVDRFAIDAETIGKTLFAPAAIVLLVSGVILAVRQNVGWTEPWLLIGIGAVVAAGAVGGAFLIPEARRLAELARTPGHDSAEIRDRARRRFLVARIDLVVLIFGVGDMVFRPGA
jgi:putative copper export protein